MKRWLALALIGVALCPAAVAKTLVVGPDRELKAPSAAAAVAADGDTVEIAPGEYFDCAVWKANHLTIVGSGAGAVITDVSCEGKALFVTRGSDITIRNLTFARARVPDGNGAGIRAEGDNLTIENSRFNNNENGLLAIDAPKSTISIADSEFNANGKCARSCAHGVYVNRIALLRIERSKFVGTKEGHNIKSLALRTELIGNEIEDGEKGTSSYLVDLPDGGTLRMENNVLEKGPATSNRRAAIMIGDGNAVYPTPELLFSRNRFANDGNYTTAFVLNWTGTNPAFDGNLLQGKVIEVSSDGMWSHRIRAAIGEIISAIKIIGHSLVRAMRFGS